MTTRVLRAVIAQKDEIVTLSVMPDIDEVKPLEADSVEDNKPFEAWLDQCKLVPDNESADPEEDIANPTNAKVKYCSKVCSLLLYRQIWDTLVCQFNSVEQATKHNLLSLSWFDLI